MNILKIKLYYENMMSNFNRKTMGNLNLEKSLLILTKKKEREELLTFSK